MKIQIITLIGTEGLSTTEGNNNAYTVEEIMKRLKNLLKKGYGYSIVEATKKK